MKALLGLLLLCAPVQAHDFWINNDGYKSTVDGSHCCGKNDCAHLTEGEVRRVTGGYLIKTTGEVVPDAEAQVGEDGYFWRCKRYDGSRRCFLTPAGGT